ncbi:hypothetical protein [Amphiplicatus metriothermophilus]|uniref:Porin n=1 Tax=Amphiplicatus metriothermophilus TaxID=1519374 RepID=A0A239PIB2_9PROT|nr:hypothetical protein [Amphiplicatus metriothermophilus]MBB5518115.1 hypothetical protein [Amphiplicatus metriothermophilus]SNT67551.1 hypothetical protein SAMN06297382_0041 [Amphiplicatus metriothermophilus]
MKRKLFIALVAAGASLSVAYAAAPETVTSAVEGCCRLLAAAGCCPFC